MRETLERPAIASAPLSVVLPAYNAGPNIDEVVTAWTQYLDGLGRSYELLVVNDGSTDDTGNRADALAGRYSQVRALHHPHRRGTGAALRTGSAAAQYPLLACSTCDKQFQPVDLERMLGAIDKVDLVSGYRVGRPIPWWLVWLDWLWRLFMRVVFGIPAAARDCWLGWPGYCRRWLARWVFAVRVQDPECAFRLFRRQILGRIPIQCDGSFAYLEILAKANFLGCWMAEVPVTCVPRHARDDAAAFEPSIRKELVRLFRHPDFGPVFLAGEKGEYVVADDLVRGLPSFSDAGPATGKESDA